MRTRLAVALERAIPPLSILAFVTAAHAGPSGQSEAVGSAWAWVGPAALLGPLGLSPFLAMAMFGLADLLDVWSLPSGLAPLGHPLAVAMTAGLAVFLHGGRSSKLTKPFAEVLGVGESVLGAVAAVALATQAAEGTGGAVVFGLAALTAVTAVVVLRTALDIMIWLSPIPLVDGIFQLAKAGLTGLLVGAVILAPVAALVLDIALLVLTFVWVRWAVRTTRFGIIIAGDLLRNALGRGGRSPLPRDPTVASDLGPFRCFAISVDGRARRSPATLELRAGRWFLVDGEAALPLGDGRAAELKPAWTGLELRVGDASVLLPPRYRHLGEALVTAGAARPLGGGAPPRLGPSLL